MILPASGRQARRDFPKAALRGRLSHMSLRAGGGTTNTGGQAADAIRQVEYWYKQYIDSFVQEGRSQQFEADDTASVRPKLINSSVLAYAHEQAWRHAVVRAQRSSNPRDWAALTVLDESNAYEHLLSWTAEKYRVSEDEIRDVQTTRGYRHHAR